MWHILPRPCEEVSCARSLPGWILLPQVSVQCNLVSEALPSWQVLPQGNVHSVSVPLRLQMPGQVLRADQVPAALLLPQAEQHLHDPVPDRLHVRQAGHVRADQVRAGHLCDMRGQGVVRRLPQGALLPDGYDVDAVPGGLLLPGIVAGADPVPAEQAVPAGVAQAAVMTPAASVEEAATAALSTAASREANGGLECGLRARSAAPACV